jgi:hypothetical protein
MRFLKEIFPMPCYTTVRTTITDLALATEAARKLGWTVKSQPERFGRGVSANFHSPGWRWRISRLRERGP